MPEEYGGSGGTYQHLAVVIGEFARHGYASFAGSMIGVHSGIVNHYILNNGSAEQKARYLPAMASGETVAAIAMTEPGAGSDLQAVTTTAKPDGNGYVLNGSKTFISNGQHCDTVVVVAGGVELGIVPRHCPGPYLSVGFRAGGRIGVC